MKALILSGGGALGAFQVGAEKWVRDGKGYQWDLIAGISIGALNGAMMAKGRYQRLHDIWYSGMSNQLVYGPLGRYVPTGLLGLESLYSNRSVRDLVEREIAPGPFLVTLKVGAVSLITGRYEPFSDTDPDILDAIVASTAMPMIWPPVDVGPTHARMVDGGIRNTSPIGDVLTDLLRAPGPHEIVIINCLPEGPWPLTSSARTLLGIGIRSNELMLNEILEQDVKEFKLVNELVRQAGQSGVTLQHPTLGRPLEIIPSNIIAPVTSLGDAQDFTQQPARDRLNAGWQRAQQVMP